MTKKAILITGATSGIGLETAKLLSKDHIIVGVGRSLQGLLKLKIYDYHIHSLSIDLLDNNAPAIIREFVDNSNLTINTIIHSAGVGLSQGFANYEAEAVDRLFRTNVYSAFALIDEFLPDMLNAKSGNVCLVSSTAGLHGYKYNGAYCATKHSLVGMVKSLAIEHGKRGIVATAICPGVVDTPMTQKTISGLMKHKGLSKKDATAKLAAINPQNRIIPASEVAEVIAFAVSGKAPALNGSALVLGGGE